MKKTNQNDRNNLSALLKRFTILRRGTSVLLVTVIIASKLSTIQPAFALENTPVTEEEGIISEETIPEDVLSASENEPVSEKIVADTEATQTPEGAPVEETPAEETEENVIVEEPAEEKAKEESAATAETVEETVTETADEAVTEQTETEVLQEESAEEHEAVENEEEQAADKTEELPEAAVTEKLLEAAVAEELPEEEQSLEEEESHEGEEFHSGSLEHSAGSLKLTVAYEADAEIPSDALVKFDTTDEDEINQDAVLDALELSDNEEVSKASYYAVHIYHYDENGAEEEIFAKAPVTYTFTCEDDTFALDDETAHVVEIREDSDGQTAEEMDADIQINDNRISKIEFKADAADSTAAVGIITVGQTEESAEVSGEESDDQKMNSENEAVTDEVSVENTITEKEGEALPVEEKEDAARTTDEEEKETVIVPAAGSAQAKNDDYSIRVSFDEKAGLPKDTSLDVRTIDDSSSSYGDYYARLKDFLGKDTDIQYVRFYDLTLKANEKEIEPEGVVNVSMKYRMESGVPEGADRMIVHFTEDGVEVRDFRKAEAQDEKTGLLNGAKKLFAKGANSVANFVTGKNGTEETTEFETDGFSVYGVVYTVDFSWSTEDGKTYEFTLPGGGFVSLADLVKTLGISDDAESFIADVEKAEFSNPELVWIGRAGEETAVGALKEAKNLNCEYSADLTQEQIDEINAQTIKAGDWALISLKAFDTEETLTVTMRNGDVVTVKVTDDQEGQKGGVSFGFFGYNFGQMYLSDEYVLRAIGAATFVFDTVEEVKQTPFTYASNGFDLERYGILREADNTDAGYRYVVEGFIPIKSSEIIYMDSIEEYNEKYVFSSKEEAQRYINNNDGVLYGDTITDTSFVALQKAGGLAVIWRRYDPAGFTSVDLMADPSSTTIGNRKDITLNTVFTTVQKGDYSNNPIPVTITLDKGLTFSSGSIPEISDTEIFSIDRDSISISGDGKELYFNITEIKKDNMSDSSLPINVKVDVSDENQAQDSIYIYLKNNWGTTQRADCSIDINRHAISTTIDDKESIELSYGAANQTATLKVKHDNVTSETVATHVSVEFPKFVTIRSANINSSCENAITNLTVKTEDGVSTLEYDVESYSASDGTATDIIDLVLDVKEKADQDEEEENTICSATENDEKVPVTKNASIKVYDIYFEVRLYGPQDAWLDMSRGDGRAHSTLRDIRFYGANDYTALTKHKWSFEENPIKGIYEEDPDGSVLVGPEVDNQYTNERWELVGFVPISYWSGEIRDRWNPLYGVYYLADLNACKQLVTDMKGVLYGETPTNEQAQALAQYKTYDGLAKVVCVWYVQESPKEIEKQYNYKETEEYIPKVHPAAYTETSKNIQVEIKARPYKDETGVHPYNVTFTIPEDYDKDIITLNTEFNNAIKRSVRGFQPGDKLQWNIKVIDKSGKYAYLKDSGAVGTIDYYNAEHMNYSTIGHGFEGYAIENADEKPGGHQAKSRVTRRGDSVAIRQLEKYSGMQFAQNPTDEKVGRALYKCGYGIDYVSDESELNDEIAKEITKKYLDDYYLDYLNAFYYGSDKHSSENKDNPHFTSFADLSVGDYRALFCGDTGTQIMETNPVVVDALYYGMYEQTILLSEEEKGIENYKGTYSWMHGWNAVTEGNDYEDVIFNQYEENTTQKEDGSVEHDLSWYQWVTGTRNGNHMQDTYFGLAYQFKLVKKVKITKVEQEHKDAEHVLSGASFKLTKVDGDGKVSEVQPLNLPFEASINEKGELEFPALLPGRYMLEETQAPTGFEKPSTPWYLNYDASGKATFEAPSTLVSSVVADGKEKFNEFWIENSPIKKQIDVLKVWDDANNQDGKRPAQITVHLMADNEEVGTPVVLSAENQWKYTFKDLAAYKDGKPIEYDVKEDVVKDYQSAVTSNAEKTQFTITNTYKPGLTQVPVRKVWNDQGNADGIRPRQITIVLTADGRATDNRLVLSGDNGWRGTFHDLAEYANGKKIAYGVQEIEVNGYSVEITGDAQHGYTITNSHTPRVPDEPDEPEETPPTPPSTPSVTPPGEVLGAVREIPAPAAPAGEVLGATRTGDNSHMVVYGIVALASAAAMIISLLWYRRMRWLD